MIKIVSEKELDLIKNQIIKKYVTTTLKYILTEYKDFCTDGTISTLGAFYILESDYELNDYEAMGLFEPISPANYEWIDEVCPGYHNMAVVIDNNKTINIIGRHDFFKKILEV